MMTLDEAAARLARADRERTTSLRDRALSAYQAEERRREQERREQWEREREQRKETIAVFLSRLGVDETLIGWTISGAARVEGLEFGVEEHSGRVALATTCFSCGDPLAIPLQPDLIEIGRVLAGLEAGDCYACGSCDV